MPLGGVACGACGAELAPGAKFCHKCGTPVALPGTAPVAAAARASDPTPPPTGSAPATSGGDALPWTVAAIAFLALIAIFAGQRFARSGSNPGGEASGAAATGAALSPMGPAPDISQMTPQEQASRLYDLIMRAYEGGHMDTVQMFAPMAVGAYENLGQMTLDERYDLGRVAEVSGAYPLAAAQADTILRQNPNHLLGLILAAQAAHSQNQPTAENKYLDRLVKAAPAEEAKKRPEYEQHDNDIKAALAQARKR